MQKEFMIKVIFREAMSGPEQNNLWDKMNICLKSIHAFGGGKQDEFSLNWGIDYSHTHLDEHGVKKHIASFLEGYQEIISDFSFYRQ